MGPMAVPRPLRSGTTRIHGHIIKSDGNLLQGYNCQAAVDGDHQVIVAMGVSNQQPDQEHLMPMLERTIADTTQAPRTFIAVAAGFCEAVAGYWSEETQKPGRNEALIPISPQADWRTVSHHLRSMARSPMISMPRAGWPASYARSKAGRTTPSSSRSWNQCLVRPKKREGCGASCCAGWPR